MKIKKRITFVLIAAMVFSLLGAMPSFAGTVQLSITSQPQSASYDDQSAARAPLTVTVTGGTPPYEYRWYGVPTKGYYRNGTELLKTNRNVAETTNSFTPLAKAGSMYYYVEVYDSTGNHTPIYDRSTTNYPFAHIKIIPNAPSGVKATNISNSRNKIVWNRLSLDNGDGNVKYQIYRYCQYYSGWQECGLGTTNNYWFDSQKLIPGVKYSYKVKATTRFDDDSYRDVAGKFSALSAATYKLPASAITKLTKKSRTSIQIKWKKVSAATGYKIYQKSGKSGKWRCIKISNSSKTFSYTKKKLKKGKTYYYKVRAYTTYQGHTGYAADSSVKYKKL